MESGTKFMFDTSFGEPESAEPMAPRATPERNFSEEELAAACEQARAEGLAAGLEQSRGEVEGIVAAALGEVARRMASAQEAAQGLRKDATQMALVIARKLAGALMAREPMAEIEAFVSDCLADAVDEPRVVIRVNEALLAHMAARVDALSAGSGFAGQIVVLAEDSLSGTDCRVEWADGGAERDEAQLASQIEAAVARYLRLGVATKEASDPSDGLPTSDGDPSIAPEGESATEVEPVVPGPGMKPESGPLPPNELTAVDAEPPHQEAANLEVGSPTPTEAQSEDTVAAPESTN
jgi:flagellar assembly protein FliH